MVVVVVMMMQARSGTCSKVTLLTQPMQHRRCGSRSSLHPEPYARHACLPMQRRWAPRWMRLLLLDLQLMQGTMPPLALPLQPPGVRLSLHLLTQQC